MTRDCDEFTWFYKKKLGEKLNPNRATRFWEVGIARRSTKPLTSQSEVSRNSGRMQC